MADFAAHMAAGKAALAQGHYEVAAKSFLAAQDSIGSGYRVDVRWIDARCNMATAVFLAYEPGPLAEPFARFGSAIGILGDTRFAFGGDSRSAFLGVARAMMDLAAIACVTPGAESEIAANFCYHARDLFSRAGSADQELAHAIYEMYSYRGQPDVIEHLGNALELLRPFDTVGGAAPPAEHGEKHEQRLRGAWQALCACVFRIYGRKSEQGLRCTMAVARSFELYDIDPKFALEAALDVIRERPELDPYKRRLKFLQARLESGRG